MEDNGNNRVATNVAGSICRQGYGYLRCMASADNLSKGKIYLLEAASGTGKSSLCSFIYGYRKDYQGIITFDGRNVRSFSVREWVDLRKRSLSMLFQEMRLFGELSAIENIRLKNALTRYASRKQVDEWLLRLGIDGKKSKR